MISYRKGAGGRNSEIRAVKKFLRQNIDKLHRGLYYTRNIMGDPIETEIIGDYIWMWTCWRYGYAEVFGLNAKEQAELTKWYKRQIKLYKAKEETDVGSR